MELIAKDIDTGKRLDKFVFNNVKNSSFFHIIKSIQNGKILVNKKQQALNYKVKIGDVITLDFTKKNEQQKEPQHISIKPKIDIRYEDDNIIIVNKPVGLASHSDHNNDDSMLNKVQKSCFSNEHIELCNRLDKNTQGLMIFTKTNIAHTEMNKLIEQKNIQKYYLTKIYGQFIKSEGLLTDWLTILNDNEGYGVSISKTEIKGKSVKIQTAYKTLGVDKYGNAILDINLLTGKKHQIRAHMAFYGHPLFGEQKYISRNMKQKGAHQALYAYKLIFNIENKNSILYYLHNKVIELDKKNIMKELEKI